MESKTLEKDYVNDVFWEIQKHLWRIQKLQKEQYIINEHINEIIYQIDEIIFKVRDKI